MISSRLIKNMTLVDNTISEKSIKHLLTYIKTRAELLIDDEEVVGCIDGMKDAEFIDRTYRMDEIGCIEHVDNLAVVLDTFVLEYCDSGKFPSDDIISRIKKSKIINLNETTVDVLEVVNVIDDCGKFLMTLKEIAVEAIEDFVYRP